jgi:radical SAM protein with 4Fe4S-binding SPASM domain
MLGKALGRALRQARAGWRLLEASFVSLPTPLKVHLCVTYRCQYRCKTCNIWRRRPSHELKTEELLQFVAANREVAWLDVSGGEVFLRSDLKEVFDAIAASWKRLALIHFPTNGFLTERIVSVTRRLAARTAAQVIVTVSVDGDQSLNDEIRGRPGGYRRQVETFNQLRTIPGVRSVLGMTLSRYNVSRVESTFRACQEACPGLRVEDFHINVAQRSDHYYGNLDTDELLPPKDQLREAVRRHRQMRGFPTSPSAWVEARYLRLLDGYLESGSTPMRCHALRSSCFVDPWGTVFPCIGYARPIGSLRETGMALGPIWSSHKSRLLQREIWARRCPQCWTACEAYQSILGNILRPEPAWGAARARRLPSSPTPQS